MKFESSTIRLRLGLALASVVIALALAPGADAQRRGPPPGGTPGAGPGGRPGGPAGGRFGGRFGGPPATPEPAQRGLLINDPAATQGYTLFAPLNSTTTYLIDMQGEVVHSWDSEFVPSAWVYMTDDGHLLRGGREPETQGFSGGGQGGRFQEFTYDGRLVWDYSLNTAERLPHHDVAILPNGHILAIAWEYRGRKATEKAGRRDGFIPEDGIWGDGLIELATDGLKGARVVWEWHVWDHLIQTTNPDLPNYGRLADHPERIDVNGDNVGTANPPANPTHDVFHINAVTYNPELDQVMISAPTYNEIWIIDHSTTTAEAASSTGGRYGHGGDLLYRWGNPEVYGRGTADDRQLGFEHDSRWIPAGYPGAGHITIFSNRSPGPGFGTTRVVEIVPPVDAEGRYTLAPGKAYGPAEPVWTYSDPEHFSATYISGAERLENGHTLISSGPQGRMFEIDADGKIVWEYWSPFAPNTDAEGAAAQNPYAIFRAIRIPLDHPGLN